MLLPVPGYASANPPYALWIASTVKLQAATRVQCIIGRWHIEKSAMVAVFVIFPFVENSLVWRGCDLLKANMISKRIFLSPVAVVCCSLNLAGPATSEMYPSHPITMVLPFSAGGPTDTLARIIAARMQVSLRQPIIIENVTGAAGTIGVGRVARAAPDGYTISVGPMNSHVLTGAVYHLPFDLLRDFEPVALLANNPSVVVSRKDVPAKDLKDLIAWVKAKSDKALAGTSGVGAATHMGGILFETLTGTHLQFIPYRGAGPSMQALVAGQIDLVFDQLSNSLPQLQEGTIKSYAVMAKTRAAAAPDIPTVDEAGLPGFYLPVWTGMWAPKDTPKDIIDKLNQAVVESLADDTVRKRLADIGQEIYPREQQTPEALRAYQKAEVEKWWPIVKAAGIKAE
jgi:tripartite-type tricarboxylate transporter receptor subunit TctC